MRKRTNGTINPFGYNRHGFAWEHVAEGDSVLDFGCHDGKALLKLRRRDKNVRRVGVDISADAIGAGRNLHPDLELYVRYGDRLPFSEEEFDVILLMDVIEHIADQKRILEELHRVLSPGGLLVVTVPGKHFFSWLDLGNYKFYFPRLHRWTVILRHGKDYYDYRYGIKNPFGLIGDIEREKGFHEHFSRSSLSRLLQESGFVVIEWDGAGFGQHFLVMLDYIVPGFLKKLLKALITLDSKWFNRANLFCVARKDTFGQ